MFIKISANKNIQSGGRQGNLSALCFCGGGEITIWQMQELKTESKRNNGQAGGRIEGAV